MKKDLYANVIIKIFNNYKNVTDGKRNVLTKAHLRVFVLNELELNCILVCTYNFLVILKLLTHIIVIQDLRLNIDQQPNIKTTLTVKTVSQYFQLLIYIVCVRLCVTFIVSCRINMRFILSLIQNVTMN